MIESRGRRDDRLRRHERPPVQPAEAPRQLPVLAERVGEPREAGDRGRCGGEQHQRTGQTDVDAQCVADPAGQRWLKGVDDSRERRLQPLPGERRLAVLDREGGEPDDRDQRRQNYDEPDRGEETAGQGSSRLSGFLGEVGDRLEPGVGEERERECEGEVGPRGRATKRHSLGQDVRREKQCEPQDHEQQLRCEIEPCDCEAAGVELRAAHQPNTRDGRNHADGDHCIPR